MKRKSKGPSRSAFNHFLNNRLTKAIIGLAKEHDILSEGDLQSYCFSHINEWIKREHSSKEFKVYNKLFLRGLGLYPDITILRDHRPWALLELKEHRLFKWPIAKKEFKKLDQIGKRYGRYLKKMNPSRHVIYLARRRDKDHVGSIPVPGRKLTLILLEREFRKCKLDFPTWESDQGRYAKYEAKNYIEPEKS